MSTPRKPRRAQAAGGLTPQQAADLHHMITTAQGKATAVLDRLSLYRESVLSAGAAPAWLTGSDAASPASVHVISKS
jgi:hypothetical protein